MTLDDHLRRWRLVPDGELIVTHSSRLLPVRRNAAPAMLKIADDPEERFGAGLMAWWEGDGAARVLAQAGDALLLERAVGGASLAAMARQGRDDEASRILCAVAARLHAPRRNPPPDLVPLTRWFAPLEPAAAAHGGLFVAAAAAAGALLAAPRDVVPLHGDLHHDNVLDFGARGWLAIDPKRLVGERGFDFANLLRNPDADGAAELATRPGRFAGQVAVIAAAAGLERRRLLEWSLAFAGLSGAWLIAEGDTPRLDLAVAALALAELTSGSSRPNS